MLDEFSAFVNAQSRVMEADETMAMDVDDDQLPQKIHISLCQLFNFESRGWHIRYQDAGTRTFNEELELYALLDLDAAGDDDDRAEVELEPAAESAILASMARVS